jgi:hypothetical protein
MESLLLTLDSPILSALWNFAGSLAGAVLGAFLAFRKLRREKAFERQLQWHEDITECLYKIVLTLQAAGVALNQKDTRKAGPAFGDFAKEMDRFQFLAIKAPLYSTAESAERVSSLIARISAEAAEIGKLPDSETNAQAKALTELIPFVEEAADGLSSDVRRQLGLSSLAPSRWNLVQRLREKRTTSTTEKKRPHSTEKP